MNQSKFTVTDSLTLCEATLNEAHTAALNRKERQLVCSSVNLRFNKWLVDWWIDYFQCSICRLFWVIEVKKTNKKKKLCPLITTSLETEGRDPVGTVNTYQKQTGASESSILSPETKQKALIYILFWLFKKYRQVWTDLVILVLVLVKKIK